MMKSKELVAAEDSENEFEVDEPEEVASDNEWAPAATVCLILLEVNIKEFNFIYNLFY